MNCGKELNKDGQLRKKRQHSSDGGPRPVGRPPSKKTVVAQQLTNGIKRSSFKTSTNANPMKQDNKVNNSLITVKRPSSEVEDNDEIQVDSQSTHYYSCDHFGNQINANVLKQHGHSNEHFEQISSSGKISTIKTLLLL